MNNKIILLYISKETKEFLNYYTFGDVNSIFIVNLLKAAYIYEHSYKSFILYMVSVIWLV